MGHLYLTRALRSLQNVFTLNVGNIAMQYFIVLVGNVPWTKEEGKIHPFHSPGCTHVPVSQSHFSLIPDPGQNKVDTSFISVEDYGVISLSRPIQFCL